MRPADTKLIQRDHERLKDNMKLIQKSFSVSELAELLGVSRPTWITKMKAPWDKFSYEELRTIARYCKVDFIQLTDGELKLR